MVRFGFPLSWKHFIMPNLAATLKEEIRRLAKKEVKAETGKTKQAVAKYRHEIARLRRDLLTQQKEIARLKAAGRKQGVQSADSEESDEEKFRYSARSVKAQRERLGLSALNYGRLVGVSGLTVYNWEHGRSRPRKAQLTRLVAVRGIGKREAARRLDEIRLNAKKGSTKARKLARSKPR
jgi:DNA-binding transcriptional regulator YiaG